MKKALLTLLCFFLAGCATSDYVKRQGSFVNSGYYDTKIQEGVYKIGFTGLSSTPRDRAEDYAFLRCADVAYENGYKYFVVKERNNTAYTQSSYMPPIPYTHKGKTYYMGGNRSFSSSPDIYFIIECYYELPTNVDAATIVYEASQVRSNMRGKYQLDGKVSAALAPPQASMTAALDPLPIMPSEDKAEIDRVFDAALAR